MSLSNENMRIQDFILNVEENEPEAKKKAKVTREVEYNIVLCKEPDLVLEKKTAKTHTQLVLLVTQGQYYTKDVKKGEVKALTEQTLQKFAKEMPEEFKTGLAWLPVFPNTTRHTKALFAVLHNKENLKIFQSGYATCTIDVLENLGQSSRKNYWTLPIPQFTKDFEKMLSYLQKEFTAEELREARTNFANTNFRSIQMVCDVLYFTEGYNERFNILSMLERVFCREAADAYLHTLRECTSISCDKGYHTRNRSVYTRSVSLNEFKILCGSDWRKVVEYMTYGAINQGYADTYDEFLHTWCDTLSMQKNLADKITDKYPDNLLTMHQRLSYLSRIRQEEVNKENLAKVVNYTSQFDDKVNGYIITSVKSMEELDSAAVELHNCLSSYRNKIVNHECEIYLIRKGDTVLAAIEAVGTEIVQFKSNHNNNPGEELHEVMEKWNKKRVKMLTEGEHKPLETIAALAA